MSKRGKRRKERKRKEKKRKKTKEKSVHGWIRTCDLLLVKPTQTLFIYLFILFTLHYHGKLQLALYIYAKT